MKQDDPVLWGVMMDIRHYNSLTCRLTTHTVCTQVKVSSLMLTLCLSKQLYIDSSSSRLCVSGLNICKSAWEQSAFTFQSEDDSISRSIRTVAEQQEE